jgi:hypothetical protein
MTRVSRYPDLVVKQDKEETTDKRIDPRLLVRKNSRWRLSLTVTGQEVSSLEVVPMHVRVRGKRIHLGGIARVFTDALASGWPLPSDVVLATKGLWAEIDLQRMSHS